jgi:hypothetical protein
MLWIQKPYLIEAQADFGFRTLSKPSLTTTTVNISRTSSQTWIVTRVLIVVFINFQWFKNICGTFPVYILVYILVAGFLAVSSALKNLARSGSADCLGFVLCTKRKRFNVTPEERSSSDCPTLPKRRPLDVWACFWMKALELATFVHGMKDFVWQDFFLLLLLLRIRTEGKEQKTDVP